MISTVTIIFISLGAVAILAALYGLYWYAFRFEPINFKLSEIRIHIKNKTIKEVGDSFYISGKKIKNKSYLNSKSCQDISFKSKSYYDTSNINSPYLSNPFLKILHLSDFHLRKDRKGLKLYNFVTDLKKLDIDFLFITGDLVEKDENFDYVVEMLDGFKASIGKYAVLGVHDYYNKTPIEFLKNLIKREKEYKRQNNVEELILKLNSIGINVLKNESVYHRSNDFEIIIAGLEDSIIKKVDLNKAFLMESKTPYKLEQMYDKYNDVFSRNFSNTHILNKKNKLLICLTHSPDIDLFLSLAKVGVDIIFCGHTHGGQVRIPLIGPLITGCNMKVKYCSGLFYFNKFVLYTTRGLGEGRYSPFRFYCQPEASLITINNL